MGEEAKKKSTLKNWLIGCGKQGCSGYHSGVCRRG